MADRNEQIDSQYPWLIATYAGDPRGGSGFFCCRCETHVSCPREMHYRHQMTREEEFTAAHHCCGLTVALERMLPLPLKTFAEAREAATVYLREEDLKNQERVQVRMVEAHYQGVRILAVQEGELDPVFRRFTDPDGTEPEAHPSQPPGSLLEAEIWTPL